MQSTLPRTGRGFTLIELLVVIAIIALLIGILLPALGAARQSARDMLCKSNMRQVTVATTVYADDFRGRFPPILGGDHVIDPENGDRNMVWYDVNRIGRYLPQEDYRNVTVQNRENQTIGGTVVRCPNHLEGARSYTMNYWAASAAEYVPNFSTGTITTFKPGAYSGNPATYQMGQAFDSVVDRASSTLLFAEAWGLWRSEVPDETGGISWFTEGSIGSIGLPGERFGGGEGVERNWAAVGNWREEPRAPEMIGADSEAPRSYIPYNRHPDRRDRPFAVEGGANMAFVDGHVEHYDVDELVDTTNGRSTYAVLWSPTDERVEKRELGPVED